MKSDTTSAEMRRWAHILSVLKPRRNVSFTRRHCVTDNGSKHDVISIGDVSMEIRKPKCAAYVPMGYLGSSNVPQTLMRHLQWMLQKDILGQDIFLIGPPGPMKRWLAMQYLELTGKEVEYMSLSRDTTETDLKQRREIKDSTAYHVDQCAVRAAIHGRTLVLEGVEKAERNVLPVLNNLLENREMLLDDGRFLVSHQRYEQLLQDHTEAELREMKIVGASDQFRVIALGLPVPRYRGNPLDPPLRSRFQGRNVQPLSFQEQLDVLHSLAPQVPVNRLSQIISYVNTMLSQEGSTLGLPDFPIDNLPHVINILNSVGGISSEQLLYRLYPYNVFVDRQGHTACRDTLKTFELLDGASDLQVLNIEPSQASIDQVAITVSCNSSLQQINCYKGVKALPPSSGAAPHDQEVSTAAGQQQFANTPYHSQLLADMCLSHAMHRDFCIIGPRGCGKSSVCRQFARHLAYHVEPVTLYQDMTARDLLQHRHTLINGDTVWRDSPLVMAAREGSLGVLDGLHRINMGTLSVLQRLIHDRELSLPDGSRLIHADKYEIIKERDGLDDERMRRELGVHPIKASFRVLALAEPPKKSDTSVAPATGSSPSQKVGQWLSAEMLAMFLYHDMSGLAKDANTELEVLRALVPSQGGEGGVLPRLVDLVHSLKSSNDHTAQPLANSLSTRQLIRIARRVDRYPHETLYDLVQKSCLARFLPQLPKQMLDDTLESCGILPTPHAAGRKSPDELDRSITCEVKEGRVRIGNTECPVYDASSKVMVPDVLFYENVQHLTVLEDMLQDYLLGEHLLLVGNQGVGKNKIVDRFLYLLNRPREYVQLHRDTTVQSLTLQPTVEDGVIKYHDSPLVSAARHGRVLVIDEADKAPTNVTCILKTLVEDGEMLLSDGRRIVPRSESEVFSDHTNIILMHPDFRMIVLANRPGFPFLGNDFFAALGDIFSVHAIDNPDTSSELSMLREYGPEVPEPTLVKLVSAFSELRAMADQGLISYPYSTREVVNIVKHLQKFPSEGLSQVVRNVFDFDAYSKESVEALVSTLHKHGIPLAATEEDIDMAKT